MNVKGAKIGKRLLFILGAGVFVIALAGLCYLLINEVQEKEDLETELKSVQNQISVIALQNTASQNEYDALEAEIPQTEAQIAVIKTQLSTSLLTSEIFQNMLTVASATNVDIIIISESDIIKRTLAGVPYHTRTLNFEVAGSALNINYFVDEVSEDLNTSILSSVAMTTSSDPAADTTATMQLTVYSYT
ncbi:MAG: hypothetical protein A2Y59_04720 [Chloroflexi bacterium RBG_13_52_14]|nr:MAG: hypothetical protein A2Y59_04720 [Chloroflexi bacterium RBG_13_52_14]